MASCMQCNLSWADFPEVAQSIGGQTKVCPESTIGFQQPVCLSVSVTLGNEITHPNLLRTPWLNSLLLYLQTELIIQEEEHEEEDVSQKGNIFSQR